MHVVEKYNVLTETGQIRSQSKKVIYRKIYRAICRYRPYGNYACFFLFFLFNSFKFYNWYIESYISITTTGWLKFWKHSSSVSNSISKLRDPRKKCRNSAAKRYELNSFKVLKTCVLRSRRPCTFVFAPQITAFHFFFIFDIFKNDSSNQQFIGKKTVKKKRKKEII